MRERTRDAQSSEFSLWANNKFKENLPSPTLPHPRIVKQFNVLPRASL